MKAYKGFDKDLKCRGYQYEVGKTFDTDKAVLCEIGFHACEYPLDVFGYYNPAESRFAEVDIEGDTGERKEDSKLCGTKIKVVAEIGIAGIVKAAVEYTFSKANWKKRSGKDNNATGDRGAASATGDQGAASATGDQGAASATGIECVAVSVGYEGKAKGALGCWIVVTERNDDGEIVCVKTHKVDGKTIKPDTFYQVKGGKFIVFREE